MPCGGYRNGVPFALPGTESVAPDCLFAFCVERILRVLESIERGRQREGRIIDVGPDGSCRYCEALVLTSGQDWVVWSIEEEPW